MKIREDETLEDGIRRFKREVSRDGIIAECKKREFYLKPGVKKREKRKEALLKRLKNKNKFSKKY